VLRVAVVGAGLAGLCLAQGLRRDGIEVTVYERDADLSVRGQGYRLHLDARAGLALQHCLGEEAFALFLASVGEPGRAVTVLDHRLRVVRRLEGGPARSAAAGLAPQSLSVSADRRTLREVLAFGLDDVLRFSHEFVSYEAREPVGPGAAGGDGVVLRFADGRSASADVLVGADGAHSVVRRQFLPGARVEDTGARCVYGRTLLSALDQVDLPGCFADGFTAVTAGRLGLACGMHRYRSSFDDLATCWPQARLTPQPDYLMWALSGRGPDLPVADAALRTLGPAALHDRVIRAVSGWHPTVRQVIERATVADTQLIQVHAAGIPTSPWTPTRVTVIGDAIHAMSPARGSGANTALADAARLASALAAVTQETPESTGTGLLTRIGHSEADLRRIGDEAVAAARQAEMRYGRPPRWLRLFTRHS